MNTKTQELTYGAMIVAIFGVMLLINRQTGGFFSGILMFVYPIPMVAFAARYGLKDSVAVFFTIQFCLSIIYVYIFFFH